MLTIIINSLYCLFRSHVFKMASFFFLCSIRMLEAHLSELILDLVCSLHLSSDIRCCLTRTTFFSPVFPHLWYDKWWIALYIPLLLGFYPWPWKVDIVTNGDGTGAWHYTSCPKSQRMHFEWWVISIGEDVFKQRMASPHLSRLS